MFIYVFQFSSVTQSYPTLCHPMDCSTPGLPVHHQLPELTQTHVHWVGYAIQPSHPLSSFSSFFFFIVVDFVIHWNETAMGSHVFPIPIPPSHLPLQSVVLFSCRLLSFPASASFQMSQSFTSGGPSIGVSASASVLPMNIQDWRLLRWTGWVSCCPRDSQESSPTPQFKSINSSSLSFL